MNFKDDINKQREESLTISYQNNSKDMILFPSNKKAKNIESTKIYSDLNLNRNKNNNYNIRRLGNNSTQNFLQNESNKKILSSSKDEENIQKSVVVENKYNNENFDEFNNQINFTCRKSSSDDSSSDSNKITKNNDSINKKDNHNPSNNLYSYKSEDLNENIDKNNNKNNSNQRIINTLRSSESDRNLITERDQWVNNNNIDNFRKNENNNRKQSNNNPILDLSKNVEEINIINANQFGLSSQKNRLMKVSKQEDKNLVDSIFYNENKNHESNYEKSKYHAQRSFFQSENSFNKLNNKQKEISYTPQATFFKSQVKHAINSRENSDNSDKSSNHNCKEV